MQNHRFLLGSWWELSILTHKSQLCWKSHSLGPRYMVLTFDVACRCVQFACDLVDVIHSDLHNNYYDIYVYIIIILIMITMIVIIMLIIIIIIIMIIIIRYIYIYNTTCCSHMFSQSTKADWAHFVAVDWAELLQNSTLFSERTPEIHIVITLWLCQHSYWKWPIEIVDLFVKHGDFPVRYVAVYQRVHWLLQPCAIWHGPRKIGQLLGCPALDFKNLTTSSNVTIQITLQ